jgi:RNA polymerase sigma-70 factor (ECF subfamily)
VQPALERARLVVGQGAEYPDERLLGDLEGLSYEEIAATLGVKVGTVRSRIHRGRVQLRETLAHRAPGVRPAEPADAEPVAVQQGRSA